MRLVAPRFVVTLRRVSVNGKRLAMSLRICSSFLVVGVVITEKERTGQQLGGNRPALMQPVS
jgi:hypothetical protein